MHVSTPENNPNRSEPTSGLPYVVDLGLGSLVTGATAGGSGLMFYYAVEAAERLNTTPEVAIAFSIGLAAISTAMAYRIYHQTRSAVEAHPQYSEQLTALPLGVVVPPTVIGSLGLISESTSSSEQAMGAFAILLSVLWLSGVVGSADNFCSKIEKNARTKK